MYLLPLLLNGFYLNIIEKQDAKEQSIATDTSPNKKFAN
jgi:hypothetical protein